MFFEIVARTLECSAAENAVGSRAPVIIDTKRVALGTEVGFHGSPAIVLQELFGLF